MKMENKSICPECIETGKCEEEKDRCTTVMCSHFKKSNKTESEEVPKELFALVSYIGEMKRNHMIMAARMDNLEKDMYILLRNSKK